jgi:hypothetical protein
MSKEASAQDLKHHARFDPAFHGITFFLVLANIGFAIARAVHHFNVWNAWGLVLSILIIVPVLRIRVYPLKVQDRVIRLEERLRLQALAPAEWHAQIDRLTVDQLVGLRFASDDEVVRLAQAALSENLNRKQIKERIRNWRADHWRV